MLKPNIWLPAHLEIIDFEGKRARTASEGVQAWVDPEGYREWIVSAREKFEAEVNKEVGVTTKAK
jgi:metallo-beta-lactamase class B